MAISPEERAKALAVRAAVKETLIQLNIIDENDWRARNWRLVPSRATPRGFGQGFPAWHQTLKEIAVNISKDPRYNVSVSAANAHDTLDKQLRNTRTLLFNKL